MNIKKISLSIVLLLSSVSINNLRAEDSCDCVTGQTFFTVRPNFQSSMAEKITSFRGRDKKREDGRLGAVQIALFGSKSTNSKKIARYFSPACKDILQVREDSNATDIDITSQHFGIFSANAVAATTPFFSSTIQFKPQQSTFGIGFNYRQNLDGLSTKMEDKELNLWFEISAPLMHVKNDMNLTEVIEDDGGGAATIAGLPEDQIIMPNMEEAFKQVRWKYGKIDGAQKKWGLADIELKLGRTWMQEEKCHIESYIGLLLPTGNKPKAEYVFEPMIGHNKHFGFIHGGAASFHIWKSKYNEGKLYINNAWNCLYLFSKKELRSFDMKNKPWSRYMEVYEDLEQATAANALTVPAEEALATPGINLFTKDFDVDPGLMCNNTVALTYVKNRLQCEIGYNFYARQKECVKLSNSWVTGPAFKAADGNGKTNNFRTIGNDFDNVVTLDAAGVAEQASSKLDKLLARYNENLIQEEDIDLNSVAHPCVFAHTIHGSMDYNWDERNYPAILGAGASYQFGQDCILNRWTLWAKGGLSF